MSLIFTEEVAVKATELFEAYQQRAAVKLIETVYNLKQKRKEQPIRKAPTPEKPTQAGAGIFIFVI